MLFGRKAKLWGAAALVRNYVLPPPLVVYTNDIYKAPKMKVAVLGANGRVGQPLSLLLKHSCILTELNLYDLHGAYGLARDLSHIETRVKVKGFMGAHKLPEALKGCDIVMICAGVARTVYMTRAELLKTNGEVIFELVSACADACPHAVIAIITNPVNSMVPLAAEVLKMKQVFNPKILYGVTTLHCVRSATFLAAMKKMDPGHLVVPVIGGHSPSTIVPLFSQCHPEVDLTIAETTKLTEQVQEAALDVLKAKRMEKSDGGQGSVTLSMAYAGARFCYSLMRSIRGERSVRECAYIKTDAKESPYLATMLELGASGYETNFGVGKLSVFEQTLFDRALPKLHRAIGKGEALAKEIQERSKK